jgi:hypothetical protein
MAEYKKDPYAVLRPELANRASALLGEILSVIRKEDFRRRSGRTLQQQVSIGEYCRGTIMLPKSSTRPNPKNLKRKIQLVSRHEFFENFPEYYNGKAVNRLNLNLDNSQHLEYDY